jgi:hypothetical protein
MNGFGIAISGQTRGKVIGDIEQPGVAGVSRKQDELTDSDHAPVVIGGFVLNVANLVGQVKAFAVKRLSGGPPLNRSASHSASPHRV